MAKSKGPEKVIASSQMQEKSVKTKTNILAGLRQKLKESREKNKALTESLQALKQSVKFTMVKELETEIKMYSEECIRLRKNLEQGDTKKSNSNELADLEDQIKKQNRLIDTIKEEKDNLVNELKKKDDELKNLKNLAASKAKKPEEDNKENAKLKEIINEQKQEILALKKQADELKVASQTSVTEEVRKSKTKLAEKDEAIKTLENKQTEQNRIKDDEISRLKSQLQDSTCYY